MLLSLQLLAIILLATAAIFLGRHTGRSARLWPLGFALPFAIVFLVILGHRSTRLSFLPPISWAVDPVSGPLLMALAVPAMLSTLIVRLAAARTRVLLTLFMILMFAYYALVPLILPLFFRPALDATTTHFDSHGICLQTHPYSCGPAAAVTCLLALHIPASESTLAIDARCAPIIGTDPWLLARAINQRSTRAGLLCQYRFLGSLDKLTCPALVSIVSPNYGGHYIAILQVTPESIFVGDPLNGLTRWRRSTFLAQWSGAALVFSRPASPLSLHAPSP